MFLRHIMPSIHYITVYLKRVVDLHDGADVYHGGRSDGHDQATAQLLQLGRVLRGNFVTLRLQHGVTHLFRQPADTFVDEKLYILGREIKTAFGKSIDFIK